MCWTVPLKIGSRKVTPCSISLQGDWLCTVWYGGEIDYAQYIWYCGEIDYAQFDIPKNSKKTHQNLNQNWKYFNPLVNGLLVGWFQWLKKWESKISLDCPFKYTVPWFNEVADLKIFYYYFLWCTLYSILLYYKLLYYIIYYHTIILYSIYYTIIHWLIEPQTDKF